MWKIIELVSFCRYEKVIWVSKEAACLKEWDFLKVRPGMRGVYRLIDQNGKIIEQIKVRGPDLRPANRKIHQKLDR